MLYAFPVFSFKILKVKSVWFSLPFKTTFVTYSLFTRGSAEISIAVLSAIESFSRFANEAKVFAETVSIPSSRFTNLRPERPANFFMNVSVIVVSSFLTLSVVMFESLNASSSTCNFSVL